MDLIYLLKSVYNFTKYSYNITEIFSEPINIIDNIYLSNIYHISNYSIIRDYNFKYIINISDYNLEYFNDISTYIQIKFIFDINMFNESNDLSTDLIQINKYSELFLEFILNAQSIVDSKSSNKSNILIYSDSIEKTNYFLIYLLKQKYNLNINQIIKLFNLKNIKINQKLIDLL